MAGRKIAIIGAHGSGKGVFICELAAELKKRSVHVGVTGEGARSSHYLLAGELVPDTEIELFGTQLLKEARAVRQYELAICDRSVFDIVMYSRLFFPNPDELYRDVFAGMEQFARRYAKTYGAMFRMTKLYDPSLTNDPIRPKDLDLQRRTHEMLQDVLDEFDVQYFDVPSKNQVPFVVGKLEEKGIISKQL